MDRLSSVLSTFRPRAISVNSRCVSSAREFISFSPDASYWLYLISGELSLTAQSNSRLMLKEGDGVWLPSGHELEVLSTQVEGIETHLFVCEFDFGTKALNPLLDMEWQWIPVEKDSDIAQHLLPLTTLLLMESSQSRCGYQVVVERLAEAYLVQMLRLFMQTQKIQLGLLAGLSDVRLARAIVSIHEHPQYAWQSRQSC
ncbi:cupin domain-containing protein [Marinomonas pontica]|uniref:cupin domain-containing protein n=1 Tax=Marinomonas pontica TaxID=264739 RepID=UPI002244A237|nr:cupin domain-containing protein [Marinomonas pontica]MCW8357148.1 cupin domain-containing protein [Marinomonas pontica]